jgi:hypothetical protein
MKTKTAVLVLSLWFAGSIVCLAGDANLGAWKLNEAKSIFSPGAPRNHTVVYKTAGGNIKVTVDGTGADGKPIHNEWSGKFDGEDYPVIGDSISDSRAYKKIDNPTNCAKQNYCKLKFTSKKEGKVTMIGYIVVPKDRKSRTVTVSGTDPNGNNIEETALYDKQ